MGSIKKAESANTRVLAKGFSLEGFEVLPGWERREGSILTMTRAISARINQNFDGWPSEELKKSYKTFLGKPIFVNHANDDPTKARGRVIAARYVESDSDRYIEVVQEVYADKFPKLAKELLEGGLDSVSMGCEAAKSKCSYCGNVATGLDNMCDHVLYHKGNTLQRVGVNGEVEDVLVYEECRDLHFFELSYVFDPADETAVVSNVITAGKKSGYGETIKPPNVDTLRNEEEESKDYLIQAPEDFQRPDLDPSRYNEDFKHPEDRGQMQPTSRHKNAFDARNIDWDWNSPYSEGQFDMNDENGRPIGHAFLWDDGSWAISRSGHADPEEVLDALDSWDSDGILWDFDPDGGGQDAVERSAIGIMRRHSNNLKRAALRKKTEMNSNFEDDKFRASRKRRKRRADNNQGVSDGNEAISETPAEEEAVVGEENVDMTDNVKSSRQKRLERARRRARRRHAEETNQEVAAPDEREDLEEAPVETQPKDARRHRASDDEEGIVADEFPMDELEDETEEVDVEKGDVVEVEGEGKGVVLGETDEDDVLLVALETGEVVEAEEDALEPTGEKVEASRRRRQSRRRKARRRVAEQDPRLKALYDELEITEEQSPLYITESPTSPGSYDVRLKQTDPMDEMLYDEAVSWDEAVDSVIDKAPDEVLDAYGWLDDLKPQFEPAKPPRQARRRKKASTMFDVWTDGSIVEVTDGPTTLIQHEFGSEEEAKQFAERFQTGDYDDLEGLDPYSDNFEDFESEDLVRQIMSSKKPLARRRKARQRRTFSNQTDGFQSWFSREYPAEDFDDYDDESQEGFIQEYLTSKTSRRRRRTSGHEWYDNGPESFYMTPEDARGETPRSPSGYVLENTDGTFEWGATDEFGRDLGEGNSGTTNTREESQRAVEEYLKNHASRRRKARRRRANDTNLDAAEPDARRSVEAPIDTSDEEAESSQFDKNDFGNNAGDDVAKPDLSTDQNWAPGEGKTASEIEGLRCAELMAEVGIAEYDDRWKIASQLSKKPRAIVQDRIETLSRVAKVQSVKKSRTARRASRSVQNITSAPTLRREAATEGVSDFLLYD